MRKIISSLKMKSDILKAKTRMILLNQVGTGYIDVAVSLMISIVLGALLLAGLYALFGDLILPTMTDKVKEMFNYTG